MHAAGNTFDVLHADVSMWTLGGEIEARFSSSFGALLSVQYRWYDTKDRFRDSPDSSGLAYYLGLPDLTAGLTLEYRYRDKFLLKAGADVLGPRDFTDWVNGSQPFVRQHVDMQVDVHLEPSIICRRRSAFSSRDAIWPIRKCSITICIPRWECTRSSA